MTYTFINDQFLPENEAMIPVKDRGLKFGDGVFETLVVHQGIPFQWERHEARLKQSLAAIMMDYTPVNLRENAMELLRRNNAQEAVLRITITRGHTGGRAYAAPKDISPSVIMETFPYPAYPTAPISLWMPSWKKVSPACLPIQVKTLQCLNSVLARTEAERNGCFEAMLMSEKGHICECSSANIFWFKGDTLYTPAPEAGILCGTTRNLILRLSPFPTVEGIFTLEDLYSADEIFLSNVTLKAQPVGKLAWHHAEWKDHPKTAIIRELVFKEIEQYNKEQG